MEKKIFIALSVVAAICLVWVFSIIGKQDYNDFSRSIEAELEATPCIIDAKGEGCAGIPLATPGYAVFQKEETNYVFRADEPGVNRMEKVRISSAFPSKPVPAGTSCEQKRIDRLQGQGEPTFLIESVQVQRSDSWPEEYHVFYQRLRGNWSDLEATNVPESDKQDGYLKTLLKSHSAFIDSETSI